MLNKVIYAINFQELHNKKFITELQTRCAKLQLENSDLKVQVQEYQEKSRKRKEHEALKNQRMAHFNTTARSEITDQLEESATPNFQTAYNQNYGGQQSDVVSDALS